MMKRRSIAYWLGLLLGAGSIVATAAAAEGLEASALPNPDKTYLLGPNDVIEMRVYQEDDLLTKVRIGKGGTANFPLIGVVELGGKTVDQAAGIIRDKLAKEYLVNPQVTVSVVEYSKRRFTVLGQVQKPGSYEIPNEESVELMQALAMSGGFTRLANPGRVTVTRTMAGQKVNYNLDAKAMAKDASTKPFEVLPDDVITVAERIF